MALIIIPKSSNLIKQSFIQLNVLCLIILQLNLINANQFNGRQNLANEQQPKLYVIQHEHNNNNNNNKNNNNLGQYNSNYDNLKLSSQSSMKKWNNQKLIESSNNSPSTPFVNGNDNNNNKRSGKQLVYTDEPVPYYHSYKHIGYGNGEGSQADQYYKPLRRNYHFISSDNVLAYEQNLPTKRVANGGFGSSSSSTKINGGTKSTSSSSSSKTNDSSSKTNYNKRKFELLPPKEAVAATAPALTPSRELTTGIKANRNGRKNLVCYYGSWAVYRPDAGKFSVENIDPFLCTHVIYGFAGLSYDNLMKPLDPWNDLEDNYGKGAFRRFTNLKLKNPDLKTLIAIGGWNEGSIKYSKMASEPESRARFVSSVVEFLKKYNFDGLDLDWEYPAGRGGFSYDKQNFVKLLKELHDAFKPLNYLLTAAVSAGKAFAEPAYDISQVSKYLDLINLMAYDYHGGWETKTGLNAPLFNSPKYDLSKQDSMLNVNWSVNYWLQQGASRDKLMLGVGSYGRSFTLDKLELNDINSPASQKGRAGPYTREPGSLGYNELCESFKREPNSWTIVRDPDYLAPYAYNNERQWVGYDDIQSLALKAQFAKSMGLGGMMMWSIETDDFLGRCHNNEKFPLLNTIRKVLESQGPVILPSTTTMKPIVVKPPSSSTARPGTGNNNNGGTQQAGSTSTTRRPSTTTPGREVEEDEPAASSSTTRRPSTSTTTTSKRPKPPTSTSTSTIRPTTTNNEFNCRADGMFADPNNCRKFIRCVSNGQSYSIFKFDCGPGTAFNEQQQYCDHIYNVPSCSSSTTTTIKKSLTYINNNHLMDQPFNFNQPQSRVLGYWRTY